ncbi:MAG TPA: NADH-quinone oxidoreductase subunit L [Acidimicrobiales bacterium]|nr:NADH-quinone oxidoreductase subunit L [Acidimicrobiales bacterium]
MNAAYAIVALPLLGAVVLLFAGRRLRDPVSGWFATVMAVGSFVATVVTYFSLLGRPSDHRTVDKLIFTWIPVANLHVNFGLQLDPLSVLWSLFVTGVGSLITLYSIGYMKGDPSFSRFFFLLNAFVFSMVVLVLADNYLFSFLGWEGVGFCSYGLIGFWFERESAAVAAKKAFVTNRVGDFGFMIALFLMFQHFGSFNYSKVLTPLMGGNATLASATATGLALMLFLGAVAKSAQIPLYMWLVDAMEGPTPVSALIHAATMVTAGVYLVARSAPIIHFSPSAQWVIACIGAATAFLAATVACNQNDIKKVLAYSTISQLGYMFLGEGSGDYTAGIFHTVMHAFFKALLFLSAGAVIHALHDEQNMKRMGALRRYLPITFPAFMIGYLALSAIPPFDGFWSKDTVLAAAWHKSPALWAVGVVTAGLTAYYMSRQVMLVFFGQARWTDHAAERGAAGHAAHGSGQPHEAPFTMTVPLIILSVASCIGWLINAPFGGLDFLNKWLAPIFPASVATPFTVATGTKWIIGLVATAFAFGGLFAGIAAWRRHVDRPALEPAFLARAWYIDDTVAATVSGPLTVMASAFSFVIDARWVDGLVNGVARLAAASGRQLRRIQTGYVRNYALGIGVGAVAILFYVSLRAGS